MIKIHNEFIGGNIRVREESESCFVLENELRDSTDGFIGRFAQKAQRGVR